MDPMKRLLEELFINVTEVNKAIIISVYNNDIKEKIANTIKDLEADYKKLINLLKDSNNQANVIKTIADKYASILDTITSRGRSFRREYQSQMK